MNKNIRKWRTNCVVTYPNRYYANLYRIKVLSVLENIALFRGIDCAIKLEYAFEYDEDSPSYNALKEYVDDLVYFRSSPRTKISSKEFRQIIDHIFEEHQMLVYGGDFEVGFQMQKVLPLYPYPKD